jgi:hypothetical protein
MSFNNRGGRPPKPVELHRLHGSYRRDRHGPLPQSSNGDEADDADELWIEPSDEAAKYFYELLLSSPVAAAMRATDSAALTLAAETWVLLNRSVDLARENPTDPAARSAVVAYGGMFDRLCSRFGLTPSDRQRLRMAEPAGPSKLAKYTSITKRDRETDEFEKDIAND